MKILSISQPIKRARNLMMPLLASAAIFASCDVPNRQQSCCCGCQQDSVEISNDVPNKQQCSCDENQQDISKNSNDNLEDVELTDGLVKNRDSREVKKLTGLNEKEFEVLKQAGLKMVNKEFSDEHGKFYYKGTRYNHTIGSALGLDRINIVYSNGNIEKRLLWCNRHKNFELKNGLFVNKTLKVEHEKNGDFSLIITDSDNTKIRNYTKDGKLKEGSYLPDSSNNS